ncbi:MAG: hypothetical protein JNL01_12985 [Bdellovibrionales bacterium]|nr:hypothetical protein [Bdellovibrionales bacterium]
MSRMLAPLLVLLFSCSAWAASARDKAKLIHERIAGVPPSGSVLTQMENLVSQGKSVDAAKVAINQASFYNLTLKNWAMPFTNVARSIDLVLNDYVATIIGMVRDNIPFDQVLYGDHLYVASPALVSAGTIPAFSRENNDHYRDLEVRRIDLSNASNLVRVNQSTQTGIVDTAGVITTRAAGSAFFSAGTNRRMFRFLAVNYLCKDLEALQDTSLPDTRVRRDVDRSPGGDSRTFKNKCVGCHALQDGVGGAFAYFNFNDNQTTYDSSRVQNKYNQNSNVFPDGYRTTDDSWVNFMVSGRNASLGWRKPSSGGEYTQGRGARQLGAALAATQAFSSCMVERVFTKVCLRPPTVSEREALESTVRLFETSNYNIKEVFADVPRFCLGT